MKLNQKLRVRLTEEVDSEPNVRLIVVLTLLGIAASSWYYRPRRRKKPGRGGQRPGGLPADVEARVVAIAEANPWYGYKRIAVLCRRQDVSVSNRQVYRVFRKHDLLRQRRSRTPELHQTSKLYELLPTGPDELWQMDVTYIHVPFHGWWYAVTIIDYYSRYLLALRFTWSYSAAEVIQALREARAEAERIHGSLTKEPFLVTDNGTSFVAKRFRSFVADDYAHVRIQYRTPTQLGLLERFHETLKNEEVYWRLYDSPAHARECLAEFRSRYNTSRPHWALVPVDGGDPLTPEEVYAGRRKTKLPRWQGWAREFKAKLDALLEQEMMVG